MVLIKRVALLESIDQGTNSSAKIHIHIASLDKFLAWISTDVSRLKSFLSNRVSKIQSFSKPSQWRYLPSNENPADVVSPGLNPDKISDCTLWFKGPEWLALEPNLSPTINAAIFKADGMSELKPSQVLISTVEGAENKQYLSKIINNVTLQARSTANAEFLEPLVSAASPCKPLEGTLLKEDHLPPMLWKMGRITKVFPGTDGIIRVVEIKTCSSTFRRAINKI
ncbi:methyltransferase (DUF5641) [Popillia japonica]|uniref:Methyltransferase (DUF5641) n=1 Tax=Popillia japonica TaxID=7064 RepID=A0AAW1M054_POPJA